MFMDPAGCGASVCNVRRAAGVVICKCKRNNTMFLGCPAPDGVLTTIHICGLLWLRAGEVCSTALTIHPAHRVLSWLRVLCHSFTTRCLERWDHAVSYLAQDACAHSSDGTSGAAEALRLFSSRTPSC
jgi:hypothetical protein